MAHDPERAAAQEEPFVVEDRLDLLEAVAFLPDHPRAWNLDVFEIDVSGRAALHAVFLHRLSEGEALHSFLENEARDSLGRIADLGEDDGHVADRSIRDERLVAVEDV